MDILKIIKPVSPEEAFDLRPVKTANIIEKSISENNLFNNNIVNSNNLISQNIQSKPFIEANTEEVTLYHLKNDCIIPVFSKDNEKTIAHQEFIEIAQNCISKAFPYQSMETPEIRVSHQIKGRIPEAIDKNVKDLLDHEKTIYYERMAFIIRITSISDVINGNELSLTIGGVRAYNQENLYNKKSFEKFKFFIGFQNLVCCNMCVSSDGFISEMRVNSYQEMQTKILEVIQNYQAENHLKQMKDFTQYFLTEHQFATLVGRARLYQHLPKKFKAEIPEFTFNDGHFNTIAKDYYSDDSFSREQGYWYYIFVGSLQSVYPG